MYKDKEKQREANRQAKQRQRQGMTNGVTERGMTSISSSHPVIPLHPAIIAEIERSTTNPDGTVDEQARTNRMAVALNYQRMYPDRPYTGIGIAPADIPANPVPLKA